AALAALAATFTADRIGRRRFLIGVTACGAIGTAGFAIASGPVALAIAGFAGMVNGMGKDRGAALILEQAALPATASDAGRTRAILAKISALFALDGLGGGFLTTALVSYFFFERFAASGTEIAALFFGARVLNAASHLGAAWLARRIGLVNTMVFTHIPSSLLLIAVPFAPSLRGAILLFLCREALVEMDVPTRQSYVAAVVLPNERTFASGIT